MAMVAPEAWVLITAFALDLLLGDPENLPHPVRWMGKAIVEGEKFWRRRISAEFWAGAGLSLSLVIGVWFFSTSFLALLRQGGELFYWGGALLLTYYSFSVRCLAQEALGVLGALEREDLSGARIRLSRTVGRDVENLDVQGITRAAVETVSENFVDGFLSPLFFYLLGGAPAALAYKAVNTLDSMIGYKNERYHRFGTFAARLDDIANYIPARLCVIPIALAVLALNKSFFRMLKIWSRDGGKHSSPNAGIPEAAFAGALGLLLGGPSYYGGELVKKPFIGEEGADPIHRKKIREAVNLMIASSCIAVMAGMAVIVFTSK